MTSSDVWTAEQAQRYDDPAGTGMSAPEMLDPVVDALAELAPGERWTLVGHSMGGMSVESFAGQFPEVVAERGERVLDVRRDHVEGLAADEAVRFQGAQRLGEHLLADA